MDKSTNEVHLFQPVQTNNKQFKIAVTFLNGYNGIFKVTNSNNEFFFMKSIFDEDGLIHITIPPGAYELESVNNEIERIIIEEGHYAQSNYPFKIKPTFSTMGSIIKSVPQGTIISFMFDKSIRELLGFTAQTLYEEYNLSPNSVDFSSFDNIFKHTNNAQAPVSKDKRSGIVHILTKDVDPGYKFIERFRGGVQWYMTESKDIISSILSN